MTAATATPVVNSVPTTQPKIVSQTPVVRATAPGSYQPAPGSYAQPPQQHKAQLRPQAPVATPAQPVPTVNSHEIVSKPVMAVDATRSVEPAAKPSQPSAMSDAKPANTLVHEELKSASDVKPTIQILQSNRASQERTFSSDSQHSTSPSIPSSGRLDTSSSPSEPDDSGIETDSTTKAAVPPTSAPSDNVAPSEAARPDSSSKNVISEQLPASSDSATSSAKQLSVQPPPQPPSQQTQATPAVLKRPADSVPTDSVQTPTTSVITEQTEPVKAGQVSPKADAKSSIDAMLRRPMMSGSASLQSQLANIPAELLAGSAATATTPATPQTETTTETPTTETSDRSESTAKADDVPREVSSRRASEIKEPEKERSHSPFDGKCRSGFYIIIVYFVPYA